MTAILCVRFCFLCKSEGVSSSSFSRREEHDENDDSSSDEDSELDECSSPSLLLL